jgi:hypothetical protein
MSNNIGNSMELCERSIPTSCEAENDQSNELEINVVFTDHPGTLSALRTAGTLAHQLRAHINILVARVVPYAVPLASPPVSIQFTERQLLDLAHREAHGSAVISVQVYLCRDRRLCLLEALRPQSLVVVGGRVRWWPTMETKLARTLQSAGHQVIFAGPRARNEGPLAFSFQRGDEFESPVAAN